MIRLILLYRKKKKETRVAIHFCIGYNETVNESIKNGHAISYGRREIS